MRQRLAWVMAAAIVIFLVAMGWVGRMQQADTLNKLKAIEKANRGQ
jgi:hypothetical protein